jgi:Domain of unknown function (DUF4145)
MDWLTFISNLVGSMAWPTSAAIIALIFRSQISTLIKNLNTLRWGDVEAEFGEKVDQIREEIREIESNPNYIDVPVEPQLINLLETHPHLAVLEGWKTLEKAIVELSARKLQNDRPLPIQKHLEALVRAELISSSMKKIINDIREVRNRAVHELDTSVSKGRAYILLDTIADIVGFLNKMD